LLHCEVGIGGTGQKHPLTAKVELVGIIDLLVIFLQVLERIRTGHTIPFETDRQSTVRWPVRCTEPEVVGKLEVFRHLEVELGFRRKIRTQIQERSNPDLTGESGDGALAISAAQTPRLVDLPEEAGTDSQAPVAAIERLSDHEMLGEIAGSAAERVVEIMPEVEIRIDNDRGVVVDEPDTNAEGLGDPVGARQTIWDDIQLW
jgi:hypothetical protein